MHIYRTQLVYILLSNEMIRLCNVLGRWGQCHWIGQQGWVAQIWASSNATDYVYFVLFH